MLAGSYSRQHFNVTCLRYLQTSSRCGRVLTTRRLSCDNSDRLLVALRCRSPRCSPPSDPDASLLTWIGANQSAITEADVDFRPSLLTMASRIF